MQVEQMHQGPIGMLKITGRIDASVSGDFEHAVIGAIDEGRTIVLLECTHLEFISSAGLRVLLMAGKRLKNNGGFFGIAGLNSSIREVFDVSGFSNLFNMYDTVEKAMAAIPESSNS
jgi:anti-anti-sigma factor